MSDAITGRLIELVEAIRHEGAGVGVGELLGAHRALAAVDAADREQARIALRSVLCSRREDLERFDRAFARVFAQAPPAWDEPDGLEELGMVERAALPRAAVPRDGGDAADAQDGTPVPSAWSEVELLLDKDFASYTLAERVKARELMILLARRGPMRRSRRTRPSSRRGHAIDVRSLMRESLRTGGEPVHRRWRAPSQRPRPVVLVCDVWGR